jgi:glutamate carboxypeptidase
MSRRCPTARWPARAAAPAISRSIVHGRSAHAGRNPEEGRNALVAAAGAGGATGRCQGARPGGEPGADRRRRAEQCRSRSRDPARQFPPRDAEAIARAQAALDAEIAASDVGASTTCRSKSMAASIARPSRSIRRRAAVRTGPQAGADLGIPIAWKATGGVCDGNNIAACGVPVVDTMGARGGAIHSAEEFLIPESLPERAALSASPSCASPTGGRP